MKPAAFAYHRPRTLAEALDLLAAHADTAKIIAGGQSLVPVMNMRLAAPAELIDVNGLPGMAGIVEQGDCIEAGALARHCELAGSALVRARCPLLALAAETIGHYVIRQRGSLGGSLAHADPTAQLPLIAVTLDAQIDVASRRGRRTVAAADFFLSVMTTALEPDEIIVAVRFPVAAAGEGAAFRIFNRRHGDFAIVAVAATLTVAQGRISGLRLGLGGVGPVPVAYPDLCRRFIGQSADGSRIRELGQAIRDAVEPEDNARIPAAYRRELAQTLTERAFLHALGQAQGSAP
ncbi:MAG: FAD binding domain-containing protein [Betaproteobacteria bacterium]|nr:FAD binding domain-containing protein [Betaproteobacteria bacterium]